MGRRYYDHGATTTQMGWAHLTVVHEALVQPGQGPQKAGPAARGRSLRLGRPLERHEQPLRLGDDEPQHPPVRGMLVEHALEVRLRVGMPAGATTLHDDHLILHRAHQSLSRAKVARADPGTGHLTSRAAPVDRAFAGAHVKLLASVERLNATTAARLRLAEINGEQLNIPNLRFVLSPRADIEHPGFLVAMRAPWRPPPCRPGV